MRGVVWALIAIVLSGTVAAETTGDDPLQALDEDDAFGRAPLSGRRGDVDDALAALDQGKGLTVELLGLPRRSGEVQAIGNGVLLNIGAGQAPLAAPPPASAPPLAAPPTGGMFGGLFPGLNFGN